MGGPREAARAKDVDQIRIRACCADFAAETTTSKQIVSTKTRSATSAAASATLRRCVQQSQEEEPALQKVPRQVPQHSSRLKRTSRVHGFAMPAARRFSTSGRRNAHLAKQIDFGPKRNKSLQGMWKPYCSVKMPQSTWRSSKKNKQLSTA